MPDRDPCLTRTATALAETVELARAHGVEWTPDETGLLRRLPEDVGHCIANPGDAIADMRAGHRSGGGHGLSYEFTRTAIVGRWREWTPTEWATGRGPIPAGTPIRWRAGPILRDARVSYQRLHWWCESLPADTRAQALTWWRTHPVDTRDLPALARLALAALDGGERCTQPAQIALFEVTHA